MLAELIVRPDAASKLAAVTKSAELRPHHGGGGGGRSGSQTPLSVAGDDAAGGASSGAASSGGAAAAKMAVDPNELYDQLMRQNSAEQDIKAIAKQISDHAEAIYQTWKSKGLRARCCRLSSLFFFVSRFEVKRHLRFSSSFFSSLLSRLLGSRLDVATLSSSHGRSLTFCFLSSIGSGRFHKGTRGGA